MVGILQLRAERNPTSGRPVKRPSSIDTAGLILLALARSFQERVGRFHFLGVAEVLTIGSATVAREIIRVPLENVAAKYRENLGGLCLEAHDRFSFILK